MTKDAIDSFYLTTINWLLSYRYSMSTYDRIEFLEKHLDIPSRRSTLPGLPARTAWYQLSSESRKYKSGRATPSPLELSYRYKPILSLIPKISGFEGEVINTKVPI